MMQGHRPGGKGSCGVEQATQGSPEPPEGARLADTLTSALRPISLLTCRTTIHAVQP